MIVVRLEVLWYSETMIYQFQKLLLSSGESSHTKDGEVLSGRIEGSQTRVV